MRSVEFKRGKYHRIGMAVLVLSLASSGFFLWLQIVHHISNIGPLPDLAFMFFPAVAGQWLIFWERRSERPFRRRLIGFTLVSLLCILPLVILNLAGVK